MSGVHHNIWKDINHLQRLFWEQNSDSVPIIVEIQKRHVT